MLEETKFKSFLEMAGLDAKQHQEAGVQWILEREHTPWMNVRGGIIADEMGLGKTIMMIGSILANVTTRTLIVLPLALLNQWYREIERTTGIKSLVYHGAIKSQTPIAVLKAAPIVLTTYGEIQISTDELSTTAHSPIHTIHWGRIVFDEAHHMRNMRTNKFKGCLALKAQMRWMMTGTPIQNRNTDLFALYHVLGFDDSLYASNMEHCMLRRTKEMVGIKISNLHINDITIPWSGECEKLLAEDIHSALTSSGSNTIGFADGLCGEFSNPRGWKLLLMLRAKQMCVFPKLLEHKFNQFCDEGFIKTDFTTDEAMKVSSKMDVVTSLLIKRQNNTNRKIVFCHFHIEMDEIKRRCQMAGLTVKTVDGRLRPHEKAAAMLAPWPDILILQINTCCEGLNLQDFNEIYFASPHWNPAVEDQAIARCHRIGQKKDVHVFRFNMNAINEGCSSQDNYCIDVQQKKRELYIY